MNKKNSESVKKSYMIPVEGSLGLLALGSTGLRAWRKVRDKKKNQNSKEK